jgi:hypothetical protein
MNRRRLVPTRRVQALWLIALLIAVVVVVVRLV